MQTREEYYINENFHRTSNNQKAIEIIINLRLLKVIWYRFRQVEMYER